MVKKLNESMMLQIIKLRTSGRSYKQIAKELSVAIGTAYKYSRGIMHSVGRKHTRKPIMTVSDLKKGKLVVIGHCLFDGAVSHDAVRYCNSSAELVQCFAENMFHAYRLSPSRITMEQGKRLPLYTICYYARNLTDDLLSIIPTFSTKSEDCVLPRQFFELIPEQIEVFLRTFWEDEGCITIQGEILGKTSNLKLRDQLLRLHTLIGVQCGKFIDRAGNAYGIRVKISKSNLLNFDSKVGFRRSIIARGINVGTNKRQLFNEIYGHLLTQESW